MEDPFNPDEFADVFADALESLSDEDTEIDVQYGLRQADIFLTMGGVDYRVTVVADEFAEEDD